MKLELTRKTDLAIRALQTLHDADTRLTGRDLAALIGTTTPFISQVVAPLVQANWVNSKPGPSGGYGLTVDPGTITILDVLESIEGPIDNGKCVLAGGPCAETSCSVHDAWTEGRRALREAFGQISIVEG